MSDTGQSVPARIPAALDAVEREDGVRIVLAVESGSRAWGFPSRDSDWDVRFFAVRPLAAYLSVTPPRDTIDRPVVAGLDLGGWDLRKALALVAASNAAALEWLASPIVYRREDTVSRALADLARDAAHLPTLEYHYDRLARASRSVGDGPIRLKSLFYTLRAALALTWMREHRAAPPMALPALIAGLTLPAALTGAIERLRGLKASGTEADLATACPEVDAFLGAVLAQVPPRPPPWDRSRALAKADALLASLLLNPNLLLNHRAAR